MFIDIINPYLVPQLFLLHLEVAVEVFELVFSSLQALVLVYL